MTKEIQKQTQLTNYLAQLIKHGKISKELVKVTIDLVSSRPQWEVLVVNGVFEPHKAVSCMNTNWREQLTKIEPKSVDDALYGDNSPTLASIKKYVGEPFSLATIMTAIEYISQSLNITRPMTTQQKAIAAKMVYTKYYHLKISELKYWADCMIMNVYGKNLYEGIDVKKILASLDEYDKDREDVIDYTRGKEQEQRLKDEFKNEFGVPCESSEDIEARKNRVNDSIKSLADKIGGKMPEFNSLFDYCEYHKIDAIELEQLMQNKWSLDWEVRELELMKVYPDYKSFEAMNTKQMLIWLNKPNYKKLDIRPYLKKEIKRLEELRGKIQREREYIKSNTADNMKPKFNKEQLEKQFNYSPKNK